MKRMFGLTAAVLCVAFSSVQAEDIKCGLSKGDEAAPFHVVDVTGPSKGTETCYRCMYDNDPVACIFTTKLSDKLAAACKSLDKRIGESKELKGFLVLTTDDVEAGKKQLTEFAKTNNLKNLPLTCVKKAGDLSDYKLDKKAETTLVCWKELKVELTKSYAAGAFCDECFASQVASFCGDKKATKSAAN